MAIYIVYDQNEKGMPTSLMNIEQKKKTIELIKGLHRIHKNVMTASHYNKLATVLPYPSLSEIHSEFGSWSNLLLEAQLVTLDTLKTLPNVDNLPTKKRKMKLLDVENSLKLCSKYYGNRFTIKEYTKVKKKHPEMLSINAILYHCDTWKNALLTNGYLPARIYTDTECLTAVKQAIFDVGLGEYRISSTMYANWVKKNPKNPSLTTLITRFGSWSNLLDLIQNRT